MACLNPLWIRNPKYTKLANGKNPTLDSTYSDQYVNDYGYPDFMICVPCGKCIECRKRIASEWKCRLMHEHDNCVRLGQKMHFITFTLSPEFYEQAKKDHYYFVRKFLEAYRYRSGGKSPRHFIVTELGEKNGRLHYHGIIFNPSLSAEETKALWPWAEDHCKFIGYVQPKTCTYIIKYILKPNTWNEICDWYCPRRYVSRGLGKCYCENPINWKAHNYGNGKWYCEFEGYKCAVPRYYRDKLFHPDTIHSHMLEFYENPPTEWRIGYNVYHDWHAYRRACKRSYLDTIKRKASIPSHVVTPFTYDWNEQIENNLFSIGLKPFRKNVVCTNLKLF